MKRINIAIDGPAGAGKSTVASGLARKLGYIYLNTGALYRTVALAAKESQISTSDVQGLKNICASSDIKIKRDGDEEYVELNGRRIGDEIKTAEISRLSSEVSIVPEVRAALLDLQRSMAKNGGVVMEGRDIGTVVLPEAELKFFMIASSEMRAKRRWEELKSRGEDVELSKIHEEVINRDQQDSEREISPLRKAEGAIEIDTTNSTVDEIVDKMYSIAKEKESKSA